MSNYITTIANNVEYRHEESDYPLFEKVINHRDDGSVESIEYRAVPPNAEIMQAVRDGLDGFSNPTWYHLLVRHGHAAKCGYYPLPLLFSSEQRRNKIAADRGTEPPKKSWIEQKREVIRNTYLSEIKKEKSFITGFMEMLSSVPFLSRFREKVTA